MKPKIFYEDFNIYLPIQDTKYAYKFLQYLSENPVEFKVNKWDDHAVTLDFNNNLKLAQEICVFLREDDRVVYDKKKKGLRGLFKNIFNYKKHLKGSD